MKSPVCHGLDFIVYLFQHWLHTRITWGAFKVSMPGSHLQIDSNGCFNGKRLKCVYVLCGRKQWAPAYTLEGLAFD